ncbi:MAG TPA: pseudouridine synthase [Candidatus Lachnoclostridium pullistercoris]|uniref:Pseudouridine synthase n=1 Tax=Candidatus Lachnoclostridium pullistercoris TaxID=2838632 RepID=A0A9D2T528_9FIRM|nr:pseudouridine synthase [Candidatus Lachnoclostridium pullistercoris]
MEEMRLNKYLSDAGVCSRREADRLIEAGKVLVDGVPAVMGRKVDGTESIVCDGVRVNGRKKEKKVLLAVNKPRGIVCTTSDKDRAENIVEFLRYPTRIYPIGRLDKDSSGLILMTNEGDIVNKILRGSNNHEKEYMVRVNRPLTEEFLERMRNGVEILDTVTKPCTVEKTGSYTFRIILTQGLNRQIRRMCDALGYRVVSLKRVRIMNIRLGDLPTGSYREVTGKEWEELNRLLAGSSNRPGGAEKVEVSGGAVRREQPGGADRAGVSGRAARRETSGGADRAGVFRHGELAGAPRRTDRKQSSRRSGQAESSEKTSGGEKRIFRTPMRRYEEPQEGQERRNVFHRKKD